MNVLLIAPPRLADLKDSKSTIPIPLLYLAAILREGGHTPHILDFSVLKFDASTPPETFCITEISRVIDRHDIGLAMVNCFTSMHFSDLWKTTRLIREKYPQLPIAAGGAHPSLFPVTILENCPDIDFIVEGEGEEQALALADSINLNAPDKLKDIQAFAYRSGNKVIHNPRINYIDDLDTLPMPAWDLINLEKYYGDHSTWYNPKKLNINLSVPLLSSRSCPFSCNFCACHTTMGRTFRKRSPMLVVDELQMLVERYNQNYFGFIDDNVNLDKAHIIQICDEIVRRGLDIQFESVCGTHIASLNKEVVDAMAKAGCVFVRLPIEHGNEYIRNEVIGKKLSLEKIYEAATNLKANKIFTSSMFIMGFAEDTCATLDDTYDLILDLELDLNYVFNLIPLPGTRVLEQAIADNILLDNYDPTRLWEGKFNLDPVQSEQSFYIKPYKMTLDELKYYRQRFNDLRVMSKEAKVINKFTGDK